MAVAAAGPTSLAQRTSAHPAIRGYTIRAARAVDIFPSARPALRTPPVARRAPRARVGRAGAPMAARAGAASGSAGTGPVERARFAAAALPASIDGCAPAGGGRTIRV